MVSLKKEGGTFREWCATRIQAVARAMEPRRRFTRERFAVYQIGALQIQGAWREHRREGQYASFRNKPPLEEVASRTVQDCWRRYANLRIYRYYRDLIRFRLVGDPGKLLRAINPSEARYLDAAFKAHVRFRLGGSTFPPMIYYKLFLHGALCDLGAFAPRDYANTTRRKKNYIKREETSSFPNSNSSEETKNSFSKADEDMLKLEAIRVGKSSYSAQVKNLGPDGTRNWYRRVENNDWRPVAPQTLADLEKPPSFLYTVVVSKQPQHKSYVLSNDDRRRLQKRKRQQWLRKLYRDGRQAEEKKQDDDELLPEDPDDVGALSFSF